MGLNFGTARYKVNEHFKNIIDNSSYLSKMRYKPLQFWYCNNPNLYISHVARQYHEIKLKENFNNIKIT